MPFLGCKERFMLSAFIDESGDEGTSDKSTPWLTLGCLSIGQKEVAGARQYLNEGVAKVWKNQKTPSHVHFTKVTNHAQRKALLNMLCGLNFTACTVALRKSEMDSTTLHGLHCPKMYNYIARHLLERLSWYAADRSGQISITFATRNEDSWKQLKTYLSHLRTQNTQIKWEHIGSIRNTPCQLDILLQAADWITGAYTAGLNPDGFGEVETLYTEILWGKFWMRKGKLWPYGTKVLPSNYDRTKEKLFRKIDAWLEEPTSIIR
jgi:hypothetical protein